MKTNQLINIQDKDYLVHSPSLHKSSRHTIEHLQSCHWPQQDYIDNQDYQTEHQLIEHLIYEFEIQKRCIRL